MTALPEQTEEDWLELQTYKECSECGTYNLVVDHFCGYCAEDFCPEPDTCTQCCVFGPAYPEDFEVY